jgi:hypothetical protein
MSSLVPYLCERRQNVLDVHIKYVLMVGSAEGDLRS